MMTEYLFLNDGNNLILEGDFGYITYDEKVYFSSQILFYSPSLHTFANNRMPFEMQIIHKDDKGNQISVSILFKYSKSDYSLFLAKLGFDKEQLKKQKPFSPIYISEDMNLSKYLSSEKDFFVYESNLFLPPCDKSSLNFILTDVMKISEMQIKNFPEMILNKNKIIQNRNERKIYTTFHMEDVERKLLEQKEKLEKLRKEKEEFERLKKLAEKKINESKELIFNTTLSNSTDLNSTINKDLESENPNQKTTDPQNKNKNTIETEIQQKLLENRANETECKDKDYVSSDIVKEKVKAFEKTIKASDPKMIKGLENKNDGMEIDKEIPDSESSRIRKNLNEKFLIWKQLYKESLDNNSKKQSNLIQMKLLESLFIENNFQPFLNFIEVKEKHQSLILTNNNIKSKKFLEK